MDTGRVPKDATIRDVLLTLSDPDRFVSRVLDLMSKVEAEQGPCVVRLGVTGTGVMPNIRIDAADGSWTRGAFDGVSFKSFSELGTGTSEKDTWSSRSMTRAEVATVLGDLRPNSKLASAHRT